MQNSNGNGEVRTKVIRCDIYAGGDRIRSFPDDRSLHILQAHRNGNALVLECLDARGKLVEVETTLPYLLIVEAPATPLALGQDAGAVHAPVTTLDVPALPYAECGSA